MSFSAVARQYYGRKEIQDALLRSIKGKEIAIRFGTIFGRRPNTLQYLTDIAVQAKNNATSFHCSEEHWSNPMMLSNQLKREELDSLRIGWDLIFDIDCGVFEYSKLATLVIIEALQSEGVTTLSVKFSGNKGFHIGIPFEVFPEKINGKEIRLLFPEAAKKVAMYMRDLIMDELKQRIFTAENHDFSAILKKTNLSSAEIQWDEKGVDAFLEIDTILIASRHLYRMPYSLHEKSGLVSLPLLLDEVADFKREDAEPEKILTTHSFLKVREPIKKNEAEQLFVNAYDSARKTETLEKKKSQHAFQEDSLPTEAIPEQYFSSCIKQLLEGVEDGRKRALFVLVNFLYSVGWQKEQVEPFLKDWNARNKEPLPEAILQHHIRYAEKRSLLPPNCSHENYFVALNIRCDDTFCKRFKNPAIGVRKKIISSPKEKVKEKDKDSKSNK